jgi:hypothetical protein
MFTNNASRTRNARRSAQNNRAKKLFLGPFLFASKLRGGRPSADFITNKICQNASVELTYFAATYGHAVTVVGAGKIYGVPPLPFVSNSLYHA